MQETRKNQIKRPTQLGRNNEVCQGFTQCAFIKLSAGSFREVLSWNGAAAAYTWCYGHLGYGMDEVELAISSASAPCGLPAVAMGTTMDDAHTTLVRMALVYDDLGERLEDDPLRSEPIVSMHHPVESDFETSQAVPPRARLAYRQAEMVVGNAELAPRRRRQRPVLPSGLPVRVAQVATTSVFSEVGKR